MGQAAPEALNVFGCPEGLQIGLALLPGEEERSQGLAWGHGVVWVTGKPIWYWENAPEDEGSAGETTEERQPTPVEWTWIDLLEFIAQAWLRLWTEESYPFRLMPLDPTKLRETASKERWDSMPKARRMEEDRALFRFECVHDLARGMRGIFLPSITLMREGRLMWICAEEIAVRRPLEETMATLEAAGNHISEHIKTDDDSRAREVIERWSKRQDVDMERVVGLRSGLLPEVQKTVEDSMRRDIGASVSVQALWELPAETSLRADSELLAVARMTAGRVGSAKDQASILREVRKIAPRSTPKLDAIAPQIASVIVPSKELYEQGYDAAGRLRHEMGKITGRLDPEALLDGWGVAVQKLELPGVALDAIACWGPNHGPVVLLNTRGPHSQHEFGANATLAHEICHLLLDREEALPMAEVLGGNAPRSAEKRARAFAAELLLPQAAVERAVSEATDSASLVDALRSEYQVSKWIIGWQIMNGPAWTRLGSADREYIEALTTAPVGFAAG